MRGRACGPFGCGGLGHGVREGGVDSQGLPSTWLIGHQRDEMDKTTYQHTERVQGLSDSRQQKQVGFVGTYCAGIDPEAMIHDDHDDPGTTKKLRQMVGFRGATTRILPIY